MNENIVDMGFFSQKQCVSPSMMCPDLIKLVSDARKKTILSSQSATENLQLLACEY